MHDQALFSPAAERNREPIAQVLSGFLPATGTVLEIASGSGQHVAYFAQTFPGLQWQPSDVDPQALGSIRAHLAQTQATNLSAPLQIDVTEKTWPIEKATVVLSCNMTHISPWAATEGLLRGASEILPAQGLLILYGPYLIEGRATAASNLAFDESLRRRDSRWGIRKLETVTDLATKQGFKRTKVIDMPANNFVIVFEKMPVLSHPA